MFDLSLAEIAIIGVVGVLVVGPKELPVVLRQIRKFMRQVREVTTQFRQQLEMMDGAEDIQQLHRELRDGVRIIENEKGELFESYDLSDLLDVKSELDSDQVSKSPKPTEL